MQTPAGDGRALRTLGRSNGPSKSSPQRRQKQELEISVHADFRAGSDLDREWFAANPGRSYRARPPVGVEAKVLEHDGRYPGTPLIVVAQIQPGARVRLAMTVTFLPPDNEEEARDLFMAAWATAPHDLVTALEKYRP